ncbi:MAG: CPBP family intramembrane metalloprotease [Oscillospiraceae bacterium]|nr:CPBP family intramembrane metalloprotease [Oscillospiraceae bacterium]
MKLYTDYALTKTVRESEKFVTPKNIFLKLLIFVVVFYIAQLAQGFVLIIFALPRLLQIYAEMAEQEFISQEELQQAIADKVKNLTLDPSMTRIMLYCTVLSTLVIFFFCKVIESRKLSTLGFRKQHAGLQYLAGLAVGFVLFSLTVFLSDMLGGLEFHGLQEFPISGILIMFGGWILQGMSEEVICRGYLMTTILRDHKPVWAILINAVLFGFMHASNNGFSIPAVINLTLFGAMISLYVLRTDNLWGACAIHSIWNFVQGNFYGLPVSGLNTGATIFSTSLVEKKDLMNGGAFGLEASLPCTVVLCIAIAVLLVVPMPFLDQNKNQNQDQERDLQA